MALQDHSGALQDTPAAPAILSPRSLLLPYQRRWADDATRWKIGLMSRQVGKDFSSGEEGVRDCLTHPRNTWLIAAPSERQSLESLNKWREWAEAYDLATEDYREEREGNSETVLKAATIVFGNGSRVIAVPGKPDTVRGYSANVLLTEFAFFEDPDATWRAILPSITNPLRGGLKKVRLISTPNGAGNKFHDLWTKNYSETRNPQPATRNSKWSCHKVSIYDAVAQGLPVDIEELRAAIDDPEGWAQEFECEFIDAAGVLLPYEVIALCESPEATLTVPAEYWFSKPQFPVDLGIDFGRKRDLTVCWAAEAVSDLHITREVLELRAMSTPDQVEILSTRIRQCRRAALDYTGPGIGLGDYLVKEFGEYNPEKHLYGKIELCTASQQKNAENYGALRLAMGNSKWRVPVDRKVREDLHSVYRIASKNGGVSYRAPHSDDGHADRCYALTLCNRAASHGSTTTYYAEVC